MLESQLSLPGLDSRSSSPIFALLITRNTGYSITVVGGIDTLASFDSSHLRNVRKDQGGEVFVSLGLVGIGAVPSTYEGNKIRLLCLQNVT